MRSYIGAGTNEITESTLEETAASVMKCLFESVRRRSRTEEFDQAIELVKKAHGKKSQTIDKAIYDGAQKLIEREKGSENETGVGTEERGDALATPGTLWDEGFLRSLFLATLADEPLRHSSSPESVRLSRASLAQAVSLEFAQAQKSNPNLTETRGNLAGILSQWSQEERSRSVRLLIEQAAQANK